MSNKKSVATTEIAKEEIAKEHSGHTIIVNGETIEIPLSVETAGPAAVQSFLEQECAKRGVSHIPAPAVKPTSEPTAPATTPSTVK